MKAIVDGRVDFRNNPIGSLDKELLESCAQFAFRQFLPKLAEKLLKDIANRLDHLTYPGDFAEMRRLGLFVLKAAQAAKTRNEEFLHKLIPMVSHLTNLEANLQSQGLEILAEYRLDHPDGMARARGAARGRFQIPVDQSGSFHEI